MRVFPKVSPVHGTLEVTVSEMLAATTHFSAAEMGMLFLLLLHQARLGLVPSSDTMLLALSRVDEDLFQRAWPEIAQLLGVKP